MNSQDIKNTPITQLATREQKIRAFHFLLDNAEQGAKESINLGERNRKYYEGDHYLQENKDGSWSRSPVLAKYKHRPRTATDDLYESISSLIPILVRSKPSITVKADDPDGFVDYREYAEGGDQLEGTMSELRSTQVAEKMTEILENIWTRRAEVIMQSQIILESLITGTAYVTWELARTFRGTEVMPKLLMREQFLGDPDGNKSWDFSDFRYCIIRQKMTAADIRYYYPDIKESDYAASSDTHFPDSRSVGIVGRWFKRKSTDHPISEEYGMNYYPVDTLYYNEVMPLIGFSEEHIGGDYNSLPQMKQLVFINKKVLAREEVSQHWHKQFPVTAFTSSPRPFRADGTSDVAILIGTQIAINLAQNLMLANAASSGMARVWMEEGAISRGKLDNSPGGVSIFNKGALSQDKVLNVPPGPVGGELFGLHNLMVEKMRGRIGNAQGLVQGNQPSNIRSGKHAQIALNQVLTRHGYRVTMLDPSWARMARQEVSNLQQHVNFNQAFWRLQHDFAESADMSLALRNLRYDVDIESKQDLPHDIESRINLLLVLLQSGLADGEEFYRQTGFNVRPELREQIEIQSAAAEFKLYVPPQEAALAEMQAAGQTNQIIDEGMALQDQAPGIALPQPTGGNPEDEQLLAQLQAAEEAY